MTYKVTVTEIFEKTISVEADSATEAAEIASNLWNNNDPVLDSPPFVGVKFECRESENK